MSNTIYGYFRNDCIHESAAALISLHRTKRGAFRAMREAMLREAMEEREWALSWAGKWHMRRKTLEDKWFGIAPVEVRE